MQNSRLHDLRDLIGENVVVRSVAGRFYTFGTLTSVSESDPPDTVEIQMRSGNKVTYVAKYVEVAKIGQFV